MIGHRCRDCLWWDCVHYSVHDIPPELGKREPGFCRKHKPGAVLVGRFYAGAQPVTDADEFCGEFRPDER
jgi:hypothetical protein